LPPAYLEVVPSLLSGKSWITRRVDGWCKNRRLPRFADLRIAPADRALMAVQTGGRVFGGVDCVYAALSGWEQTKGAGKTMLHLLLRYAAADAVQKILYTHWRGAAFERP